MTWRPSFTTPAPFPLSPYHLPLTPSHEHLLSLLYLLTPCTSRCPPPAAGEERKTGDLGGALCRHAVQPAARDAGQVQPRAWQWPGHLRHLGDRRLQLAMRLAGVMRVRCPALYVRVVCWRVDVCVLVYCVLMHARGSAGGMRVHALD